jgi:hypothetical protein
LDVECVLILGSVIFFFFGIIIFIQCVGVYVYVVSLIIPVAS